MKMADYKRNLIERYWNYQRVFFPIWDVYFERPFEADGRPPVFLKNKAYNNVITKPRASQETVKKLYDLIGKDRHKWYRSMNSSQALAQSVFGNLVIYGFLDCLNELEDDTGYPLMGKAQISSENFFMEYKVNYLGEPRQTSLDAFFLGRYRVAFECKFTESEVGSCSRPRLKPSNPNYMTDFCDGNFTEQRGRKKKCSLTEIGVLYWNFVPELFWWRSDIDHNPCPLYKNYQLVRNILAVSVQADGKISAGNGHVAVIYDERNPAFQKGGKCFKSYEETKQALKAPSLLRKCSWQRILGLLRKNDILPWLTDHLERKYGL